MKHNEMLFQEAIEFITPLCPIKVVWNDKTIIYNDYDSDNVCTVFKDGTKAYGEIFPLQAVIPQRLGQTLEKYDVFVKSFNVEIVDYHHTLVYLYGYKKRRKKTND